MRSPGAPARSASTASTRLRDDNAVIQNIKMVDQTGKISAIPFAGT